MKNPFMAMWLCTMNSCLKATRAFWASILHPHGPEEKDSAPGTSAVRAPVEPEGAVQKTPERRTSEPVDSKAPETPAPSDPADGRDAKEAQAFPSKGPTATRADTAAPKKRATGERQGRTEKASRVPATTRGSSQSERKSGSPAAAKSGASDAKYRNPDDPSQTWSGRGRRPRWLTEALEAGRKLDDLQAGKR